MKENGFRWSPKEQVWQRQLNGNAYYAADRISAILPLSGEKPTDLQRKIQAAAKTEKKPSIRSQLKQEPEQTKKPEQKEPTRKNDLALA